MRHRPSPSSFDAARSQAARLRWGLVALLASEGFLNGWASGVGGRVSPATELAYTFAQAALAYAWWHADAQAHPVSNGSARPLWLSGWIIALPLVGVPVHLWRSRPRGRRAAALARFAGFVVLLALAYLLSGAPMAWWLGGR